MKSFCSIAYWIGVVAICLCILPLAVLGAIIGSVLKLVRKAKD